MRTGLGQQPVSQIKFLAFGQFRELHVEGWGHAG